MHVRVYVCVSVENVEWEKRDGEKKKKKKWKYT